MGSNGDFDDLPRAFSAGTSSGGGGGDAAPPSPPRLSLAPPPAPPSRVPSAPAASPPPLQPPGPPPHPADEDMDEVPDDEGEEPEEEDDGDWNWDQEERDYHLRHLEEIEDDADAAQLEEGEIEEGDQDRGENIRGSSDSKFFSILYMSDRTHVPDDIIRDGFVPLNKLEYFSRHKFWRQLLGRYRSYHRPPIDHPVVNGAFRRPHDYPRALGFQSREKPESAAQNEPIMELIRECSNNDIIQEKIKILSKQYGLFRSTRSDGSRFYRALLFCYLENLGQMQDRKAEVIRLMKCVQVSIKRFYQIEWKEAYFLNAEKYFLSVVKEFYSLVKSVANGLTSDKLYERSLEEISSGRIISFLRLLTEIEIRTQNMSKVYVPEEMIAIQFCSKKVRGLYAEAGAVQMRALTYALGIPLRVEIVDIMKWADEAVRVKRLDFFRESDLGKGHVHIVRSYHSSSTAHKPLKRGSDDDLLSSDGAPMLTLLSRRDHCDILYPK